MTKLNIDCLTIIFNELRNKKSLYSCLLVNKEWCNIVVPILWKNHSYCYNEKLCNVILSLLPPSSKQILFFYDVKLPSTILLKPPLFNYISFCEIPRAEYIQSIATMGVGRPATSCYQGKILEQEIYKLFISQCKNITSFFWNTSHPISLFPGASTCFSQLYYLHIDIHFVDSDALYGMAQICKGLNKLSIYGCYEDRLGLISLIDAQRNLKRVTICDHRGNEIGCEELKKISEALERKGGTIEDLDLVSFRPIPTSLINLKRVSIDNEFLNIEDIDEFQQYLAIAEFPNLQNLTINGLPCFKEISLLIEKTMGNVSMVDLIITNKAANNTGMLIKAIANNCPNIKTLSTYLEPKDFIHVRLLLLNCRNLGFISFDSLIWFVNGNDIGDELLDILTEFTSKSLTHLTISNKWEYSIASLKRFLESCRNRTLAWFKIVDDNQWYMSENYSSIIRTYVDEGVIEESNLYLSILEE